MFGVFFLLRIVASAGVPFASLLPEAKSARRLLAPAAVLVLLATPALIYVAWVTPHMQHGRGVPTAWCPFALIAMAGFAALAAAREDRRDRAALVLLGMVSLFFCLEQIAVMFHGPKERLARSVLQPFLLPVLGSLAMLVPQLRSGGNAALLLVLGALGYTLLGSAERVSAWLVAPTQAYALLYVVAMGLGSESPEPASSSDRSRSPSAASR